MFCEGRRLIYEVKEQDKALSTLLATHVRTEERTFATVVWYGQL